MPIALPERQISDIAAPELIGALHRAGLFSQVWPYAVAIAVGKLRAVLFVLLDQQPVRPQQVVQSVPSDGYALFFLQHVLQLFRADTGLGCTLLFGIGQYLPMPFLAGICMRCSFVVSLPCSAKQST